MENMAFLQAIYIVVFVLHNSIYCSRIPFILTARDSLTTETSNLVEIVTPVYNPISDQEAISTTFSYESNTNPTDKIYFPTEIPLGVKEVTTIPDNAKNKSTETFLNKFGQRLPKFFGRLALLAGLRLSDEMSNTTTSINFNSAKESSPQLSQNSSPTKLSPYFAAVYEPFPFYPQTYIYSNLLGLIPLLNTQKLPSENNFPFSQQSANNDDRISQDFNFVAENRKNENNTIEERIIEKVPLDKKQRNSIRDKMRENTKIQTKEKEAEEEEEEEQEEEEKENEEIEDNEKTTDETEEDYEEEEEANVDLFVPTTKTPPVKTNKVSPPSKFSRQRQKTTTKRPAMKKTTMTPMIVTTTEISKNNSKNMNSTTQAPWQNNATYPTHPGYYGGFTQNIHDLYFTSSEYPPLQDHFNYNEINHHPHSEEWPSNRIPHEAQFYNPYQPIYDILPHREEEYDSHSFHGSPETLHRGFKPSIPF